MDLQRELSNGDTIVERTRVWKRKNKNERKKKKCGKLFSHVERVGELRLKVTPICEVEEDSSNT